MPDEQVPGRVMPGQPGSTGTEPVRLEFVGENAFELELRRRVDEYFRTTGRRPRDCWQMYYPGLSKVVEGACRDFGVKYQEHRSFWAGVAAHYRWLREMGRPVAKVG
jgi:hypothetical protein